MPFFTPVWSNASPLPITISIGEDHSKLSLKCDNINMPGGRLKCLWGSFTTVLTVEMGQYPYGNASQSAPSPWQQSWLKFCTKPLPRDCRSSMQFYMAADERSQSLLELHSSGKFIMLAEYRHPYQKKKKRKKRGSGKVTVAGALNHIEGKHPCLYFSSSLRCK